MVTQLTKKEYITYLENAIRRSRGNHVTLRRLFCDTLNIRLSTKERILVDKMLKEKNNASDYIKKLKDSLIVLTNKIRTLKPELSNQAIPSANTDKRWLFVCAYGQSRSRWFSERFMMMGVRSLFCGYEPEADIMFTRDLVEWADKIVCLDKDFHRVSWVDPFITEIINDKVVWIDYFIQDESNTFLTKFKEFSNQHFTTTLLPIQPQKHTK